MREAFAADASGSLASGIVVHRGQLACFDPATSVCASFTCADVVVVPERGSIAPGPVSARAPFGLQEID